MPGATVPHIRGGAVGPIGDGAVLLLALGVLALHLLVNLVTPYGVHRDELLYLAMGRHLRLLHMDFPPLIAIVAVEPVFLRPGALFQPVVFDQLWWTLGLLMLLRVGQANSVGDRPARSTTTGRVGVSRPPSRRWGVTGISGRESGLATC